MKLHVENFAKIKEADIEINGITVLAGENSTGKSTISKLLFCLFQAFYNYEERLYKQKFSAIKARLNRTVFIFNESQEVNYKSKIIRNRLIHDQNLINEIANEVINAYENDMPFGQYINKFKLLLRKYDIEIDEFETLANQFFSILSTDKQQEINKLMSLSLSIEFGDQFLPIDNMDDTYVVLKIKDKNIAFNVKDSQQKINVIDYRRINNEVIYYDSPFVIDELSSNYNNYSLKKFFYDDKDGTFLNHSDHMVNILKKASDINETNIYNQILSDNILLQIEKEIIDSINGDFIREDSELKFKEKNLDVSINISNLSTGVKSFAILLKLIKDFKITENATIILDEPEIHLHPKWQLKYAELLVLLQKTLNLHILISSHSPYFIRAIQIYSAKSKIADKCKYYLADIDQNYKAFFEDVTIDIEKIYKKLAEPFQVFEDLANELNEND